MKVKHIEMATTSTGKPYKKVTLDGQVMGKDRFNIFSFHTRYHDVVEGLELAPTEFEPDGQYVKLVDPDKGIKTASGGSQRKSFNATQAVAMKQEGIKNSMEHKDHSIKTSSTFRDATMLTVAWAGGREVEADQLRGKWIEFRAWLWGQYDHAPDGLESPLDNSQNIPFN